MIDIYSDNSPFTRINFHAQNGELECFEVCNKCGSTHIKQEIIKDFADIERDVINEHGDLVETKLTSVDATQLICEKCGNSEILD